METVHLIISCFSSLLKKLLRLRLSFQNLSLKFLLLFLAQAVFNHAYAQLNVEWDKRFGGTANEYIYEVTPTPDGGYLLSGYTESPNAPAGDISETGKGSSDYWLVKVDATGTKLWDRRMGSSLEDFGNYVLVMPDGTIYIAGISNSSAGGNKTENLYGVYDNWLLKLSSAGTIIWDKQFGGTDYEGICRLTHTADGNILMASYSKSGPGGNKTTAKFGGAADDDFWAIKLDLDGNILWQQSYGGAGSDITRAVIATSDGGYLIGGSSVSNISGSKSQACFGLADYWVVKIDALGVKQWDRTFGGTGTDELYELFETSDGGYLLLGNSDSGLNGNKTAVGKGNADIWAVKVDGSGNAMWDRTYGNSDLNFVRGSVATPEGNLLITGLTHTNVDGDQTESSNGTAEVWTLKIDPLMGNIFYDRVIGGPNYDVGSSIKATSDGGYIISAMSDSGIGGDRSEASRGVYDYWIIKTGDDINDPPVAGNNAATTTEEVAITIDVLANDSDPDTDIDITSVAIASAPAQGTATVNVVTGIITYTPNTNFNGNDSFTYTAEDVKGVISNAATVTVTVTPINDTPSFAKGPDQVVVEDAGTQTVNTWATSIDDGDAEITQTLTFSVTNNNNSLFSTQPAINAVTGNLTYRTANNAFGTAIVTVQLSDNGSNVSPNSNTSTAQTFTITVQQINDAPSALEDFYSTSANTAVTANALSNDSDIENNTLTVNTTPVTPPSSGTVVISANGNFTYTPSGSFVGNDSFVYQVCDNGTDNGVPASRCSQATVNVIVNPSNPDYNIVGNNSIQTAPDCFTLTKALQYQQGAVWRRAPLDLRYSFELNFSSNFSSAGVVNDAGADGIIFVLQRDNTPPPQNVAGSPINARGTPGEQLGYGGISPSIGIEFDTHSNTGEPNYDHIAISRDGNVGNIIAAPVAAKVDASSNPLNIEDGINHTIRITWDKPNNTLKVFFDNVERLSYTQDVVASIFGGNATNIYWGFAASTGLYENYQGVCGINMNTINLVPIAGNDASSTNEDTALNGAVLGNDSDPESGTLTVTPESKATVHGSVSILANGTYTYTPNQNFNGSDSFTYSVCDNFGVPGCSTGTVAITVNPVNDTPISANDSYPLNEDTPFTANVPGVLDNDSDVDANPLTAVLQSNVQHGSLSLNANGSFTYTPFGHYFGSDSFTYYVNDGTVNSLLAAVTLTIAPVNDAPNAANDQASTTEDASVDISVLSNDNDVDNQIDPATVTIASGPSNGTVLINSVTGIITYTPNANFFGNDSFVYTVRDVTGATSNGATVALTITPVNDAPVANNDNVSTQEDNSITIQVLANDTDLDSPLAPSSITIVSQPLHGAITVDTGSGSIVYNPETSYNGGDTFTYIIRDTDGSTSNEARVNIIIAPLNNAPIAINDGPILHSTTLPITIDVLLNDYDIDNNVNELTITSVTTPTTGTASIINGQIVYTPSGEQSATVTFSYTIQDPAGLTAQAIVTVLYEYRPLQVSEGFSPNGDSNNDTWYIRGIESYPTNRVQIFDRWGLLVYQTENYDNSLKVWDGRSNTGVQSGKTLDHGTYYYLLTLAEKKERITGYVMVVH